MGMEKPRRTKALKNNLGEGDRFTAKPAETRVQVPTRSWDVCALAPGAAIQEKTAEAATDITKRFMVLPPGWVPGMRPEGAQCT